LNLRRARSVEAGINLTPLIDILFIVLLFLVLTATFREATRLRVQLPEAGSGMRVPPGDSREIRVGVSASGELMLGDRIVDREELEDLLATVAKPSETTLLLSADERAEHGRVVGVMDLARRHGIRRIGIETLHRAGGAPLETEP